MTLLEDLRTSLSARASRWRDLARLVGAALSGRRPLARPVPVRVPVRLPTRR